MTDQVTYYDLLNRRCPGGIDGFNDQDCEMFEKYFQFMDATGRDWELLQLKTKFSAIELRCYVDGDEVIQGLATNLEDYYFISNGGTYDD